MRKLGLLSVAIVLLGALSPLGKAAPASATPHRDDGKTSARIGLDGPPPNARLCKGLTYSLRVYAWNGPESGSIPPVFIEAAVTLSSKKGTVAPAAQPVQTTGVADLDFSYTPNSAGTDSLTASLASDLGRADYTISYKIEESCSFKLKEVSVFSEGDQSTNNYFIDRIGFMGIGHFGVKEDGKGGAELVVGSAQRTIERYFDTEMKGMHGCQLPIRYSTSSRFQVEGSRIEPPTYLELVVYYDEVNFPSRRWKCFDDITGKDDTFEIRGRQWSEILQFAPETLDFRYTGGTYSPEPFDTTDGGVFINFNTVFTLTKEK